MAELQIVASAPELDTTAIGIFFQVQAGHFSMKGGLVCDGSTNIARIIGVGSTDCYPHTKQKDLTDRSQISFRLLLNIGDTTACWYCIGIEGWGRVSVQNEARLHANKPTPKSSQQNYNIQ
jgi:hypothetical protein